MAHEVKEVHHRTASSHLISWLALIIAILALTLAWMAYNRSGEDLENRIQEQVNQTVNQAEDAVPKDVDVEVKR